MKIEDLKVGHRIKYYDVSHDIERCGTITEIRNRGDQLFFGMTNTYFNVKYLYSISAKYVVSEFVSKDCGIKGKPIENNI